MRRSSIASRAWARSTRSVSASSRRWTSRRHIGQGTGVMARNAFYAQSGGVTAVINARAAGVVETARKHRRHIGKGYAGRHGILGALSEDLIDTSRERGATNRRGQAAPAG